MDHAVAADHDQGVGSLGDGLVRHVLTLPNVPAGKLPNGEPAPNRSAATSRPTRAPRPWPEVGLTSSVISRDTREG